MRPIAREWLPDTAIVESELIGLIDSAMSEWSAKWFGDRPLQRIGKVRVSRPAGERSWRRFASGIWLDWHGQAPLALARHALALGAAHPKASRADERLLAHYAERIADELASQIAAALGGKRPDIDTRLDGEPEGSGIEFKLRSSGDTLTIHLFVEASALVVRRKRLCSPWRARPASVANLSSALAASSVAFEASLGFAEMSALDLQNIALGDVIVLERATTDPVLLRACESDTIIAGARLVREDGHLQLKAC